MRHRAGMIGDNTIIVKLLVFQTVHMYIAHSRVGRFNQRSLRFVGQAADGAALQSTNGKEKNWYLEKGIQQFQVEAGG